MYNRCPCTTGRTILWKRIKVTPLLLAGAASLTDNHAGPLPLPIPAPLQPISSIRPVVCNICGKDVAGSRFAVHLERCMNGGKRSNRRHYEVLGGDDLRKAKKEIVDPFPQSMVVRVKVRAGGRLLPNTLLLRMF